MELKELTPEWFAFHLFRMRREIVKILDETRASGNKREIRTWETQLRKQDRLIRSCGLNPNA